MIYLIQGLVLLGLIVRLRDYRRHRHVLSLIVSIISTSAIIYGLNHMFDTRYIYGGIIGLMVASVLNSVSSRRKVEADSE